MRMKEICAATGLTDRAVRLYMEEGLIDPCRETSYSGRESIRFDERDLEALKRIAVLRRTGFSIADIRAMQNDPSCIGETADRHRAALQEEIRHSREISDLLDHVCADAEATRSYAAFSDALQTVSAPAAPRLQETFPSERELYVKATRFVLTPAALLFSLTGAAAMLLLMLKVLLYSDGGISVRTGGGYRFSVVFTPDRLLRFFPYLPTFLLFFTAPLLLFLYIRSPKLRYIFVSLGCMALGCGLFLLFPGINLRGEYAPGIFEFLFVRVNLGLHIANLPLGYLFCRILKFLPFLCSSLICAGILLFRWIAARDIQA